MTDEHTTDEVRSLVARAANPYRLDTNLQPVDWRTMREAIDPQGVKVQAKDLDGETFTIIEFRPLESTYDQGPGVYYWVKAVNVDGELFNTTLGGQAVVEVLEGFDRLRSAYQEAKAMGDDARAADLEQLGAGRPFTVTLRYLKQGKWGGYYVFD